MPNVLARIQRFWRDQISGPELPNYDAACEELGGRPWIMKPDKTDRWFVGAPAEPAAAAAGRTSSPEVYFALTTGDISLTRTMSERTKLLLLGGSALAVIIACVISLANAGPGTSATPLSGATPAAAIPVATSTSESTVAHPAADHLVAAPVAAPRAGLAPVARTGAHAGVRGNSEDVRSSKHHVLARHRRP
jgi:hypothetical protein